MKYPWSIFIGLCAMILAISSSSLPAAAPSGDYIMNIVEERALLWDPSGNYETSVEVDGDELVLSYSLQLDGAGSVLGTGTFVWPTCGLSECTDIMGNVSVRGRLGSRRDATTLDLRFNLERNGIIDGVSFVLKSSLMVRSEIDPASRLILGTLTGNFRIQLSDGASANLRISRQGFAAALPEGADGQWTLKLYGLQPDPNRPQLLTGSGEIVLSSGLRLPLEHARGRYQPHRDRTILVLRGSSQAGAARSLSVRILADRGSSLNVQRMAAQVGGQRARYVPPPYLGPGEICYCGVILTWPPLVEGPVDYGGGAIVINGPQDILPPAPLQINTTVPLSDGP